jgi:hypothetical protein
VALPAVKRHLKGQGHTLLQQQIDNGRALWEHRPLSSDDIGAWDLVTRNYLEKAFGKNSANVTSVTSAGTVIAQLSR